MIDKVIVIRNALQLFEILKQLGAYQMKRLILNFSFSEKVFITSSAYLTVNDELTYVLNIDIGDDNYFPNALGALGINSWGPEFLLDDSADPYMLLDNLTAEDLYGSLATLPLRDLESMKLQFTKTSIKTGGIFSIPNGLIIAIYHPKDEVNTSILTKLKNYFLTKVNVWLKN